MEGMYYHKKHAGGKSMPVFIVRCPAIIQYVNPFCKETEGREKGIGFLTIVKRFFLTHKRVDPWKYGQITPGCKISFLYRKKPKKMPAGTIVHYLEKIGTHTCNRNQVRDHPSSRYTNLLLVNNESTQQGYNFNR